MTVREALLCKRGAGLHGLGRGRFTAAQGACVGGGVERTPCRVSDLLMLYLRACLRCVQERNAIGAFRELGLKEGICDVSHVIVAPFWRLCSVDYGVLVADMDVPIMYVSILVT